MITTAPNLTTLPPEKPKRRWVWPVIATVALFAGIAIGGGGDPPATDPEVRTETIEKEVEVTVVPAECLAALADADALNDLSADFATITSDALGLAADAMFAAATFDVAEVERVNAEMEAVPGQIEAITAQVQGSTYAANRDACRAAG